MPVEKQVSFEQGLNNRNPAFSLPEGFSPSIKDADLSFSDLRPEKGKGTDTFDPAGSRFFYEAASAWVGATGFSTAQYSSINLTGSSTQTISSDTSVEDPVVVGLGSTLTVSSNTLSVFSVADGFETANAFVEYADDLYVSRNGYDFTATNIANVGNVAEITYSSDDTGKFHIGDVITGPQIDTDSTVTDINKSINKITLSKAALTTSSATNNLSGEAVAIRFMDGNIGSSFGVGVGVPEPTFELENDGSGSVDGYSYRFISSQFPIPFQYGISALDNTDIESGLSEPSSQGQINSLVDSSSNNGRSTAIKIDIGNVDPGKYFMYRIGDTSAVYKLLDSLYIRPSTTEFAFGTFATNKTTLTITDSGMPTGSTFAIRWSSATSGSKASGTSSGDKTTEGTTAFSAGPTIDLFHTANTEKFFTEILVKFLNDSREYVIASCVLDTASGVTNANMSQYVDFKNARALPLFSPFSAANQPPRNLQFMTEVNNFFFAAREKRLFLSRSSQPNVWPIDAFIDFDAKITGLGRRGSELVVFTQFALFRVFGNAYDSMRKVEIPTREGIPDNLYQVITEVKGGIIYANLNGIHYYDGSGVQNLTKGLIENFTLPSPNFSSNVAGTVDDQYYLVASSGDGYKIDMRNNGMRISRTSLNATNLFFRGATNRLYTEDGIVGIGNNSSMTAQTREFVSGDVNQSKIMTGIIINADNFTGTLTPVIDGVEETTEAFTFTNQDLNRSLYLSVPTPGERIAIKIEMTGGELNEIGAKYEDPRQYSLARYDSITVKYTGSPSFSVKIDEVEKISTTALPASTDKVSERIYYFPAMTEGYIPHFISNEDETNKIVGYTFASENI